MTYSSDPARDASILVQVAFKGAVELTAATSNPENGWSQSEFERTFAYLQESLNASVAAAVPAAPAPRASAPRRASGNSASNAVASLKREFGGGTEQSDLRIIADESDTQGPHPDWLYEVCAERGIKAVKEIGRAHV